MSSSDEREPSSFFDMLNKTPEVSPHASPRADVVTSDDSHSNHVDGSTDDERGGTGLRSKEDILRMRIEAFEARESAMKVNMGANRNETQSKQDEKSDAVEESAGEQTLLKPPTTRLRGLSIGSRKDEAPTIRRRSEHAASSADIPIAETRQARSRTLAGVFESLRRPGSNSGGSNLSDGGQEKKIQGEDVPMAFSDFLEQEQESASFEDRSTRSPNKLGVARTRSRGFNISLRENRKSPSRIVQHSPSPKSSPQNSGRKGSGSGITKKDHDLTRHLEDPETCLALRDFSIASLCEENIDALLALRDLSLVASESLQKQQAESIMRRFVQDDASQPVNVDAKTRSLLVAEYAALQDDDRIPMDLFDAWGNQIRLLMQIDCIPRFWMSPFSKVMSEGAALRQMTLGPTSDLIDGLRRISDVEQWVSVEAQDGIELWSWGDPKSKAASHRARGVVHVSSPAAAVAKGLACVDQYSDWCESLFEKSVLVKDFGSFFRVASMQMVSAADPAIKIGMVVGSLCVFSDPESRGILLQSIAPAALDLRLAGGRFLELDMSGFIITPLSDSSCSVSLVLSFKQPLKKKSPPVSLVLASLLSNVKRRDYCAEAHLAASKSILPEEFSL